MDLEHVPKLWDLAMHKVDILCLCVRSNNEEFKKIFGDSVSHRSAHELINNLSCLRVIHRRIRSKDVDIV